MKKIYFNWRERGELTTTQIVLLVILIVSFAVILLFFSRIGFRDETDKEICHNSVVLKGTSKLSGSLNCKTNYICISAGGECTDISSAKKIDVAPVQNEIFQALADEMADCWWMFGEGEINYRDWELLGKNHCGICANVKFDSAISETFKEGFAYSGFYDYLGKANKSAGVSYLNYLYGVSDVSLIADKNLPSGIFSPEKKYFIITGIDEEDNPISVQFRTVDELSNSDICGVFDITRA